MARLAGSALALALAITAVQPTLAAEVYVPYAVRTNDHGVVQRTELVVTNTQPSLAQTITFRWLASDGGRGRAQTLELAAGETRLLDGLVPNGRRGMIAFDAPLGMAVSARLIVEAPGNVTSTTTLPVVDGDAVAPATTRIVLQGLENTSGQRSSAIGILNTGAARATCEATLRGADAGAAAATIQFEIAGRSQILGEDVFAMFGGPRRPARAFASVTCDHEFWAYGTVEDRYDGTLTMIQPSFDAVAVPVVTKHSLTGSPNSIFFRLPGEFLVCNKNNKNWQYDMRFGTSKTFKKIKMDFDVYISSWSGQGPLTCEGKTYNRNFHTVFWLNNGSKWADMLGYMNLLGTKNQTRLEINKPIYVRDSAGGSPQPGSTYHVHYEFDGPGRKLFYKITKNGALVKEKSWSHSKATFSTSYQFIQFGTQNSHCGPEATTYGWRFSNFVGEYLQ